MKTLWLLLWCVDSCLNGVYTEGPKDWERQAFCTPGECNTGAVCDAARRDVMDKGLNWPKLHPGEKKRWVQAFCDKEGDIP